MRIVWDPAKAKSNLRKHGIHFSDAEAVLFDPLALTQEDPSAQRETRFVSVGMDHIGRILVVVFNPRGEELRLISARLASPKERHQYEEGIRL